MAPTPPGQTFPPIASAAAHVDTHIPASTPASSGPPSWPASTEPPPAPPPLLLLPPLPPAPLPPVPLLVVLLPPHTPPSGHSQAPLEQTAPGLYAQSEAVRQPTHAWRTVSQTGLG